MPPVAKIEKAVTPSIPDVNTKNHMVIDLTEKEILDTDLTIQEAETFCDDFFQRVGNDGSDVVIVQVVARVELKKKVSFVKV